MQHGMCEMEERENGVDGDDMCHVIKTEELTAGPIVDRSQVEVGHGVESHILLAGASVLAHPGSRYPYLSNRISKFIVVLLKFRARWIAFGRV